jgi:hypothetical protein
MNALALALREVALGLPGVEEGVSCAGTALQSSSFKARKKAFLFIGPTAGRLVARLKLGAESASRAGAAGCVVGANGWVTVPLDGSAEVDVGWVEESFRIVTGHGLVVRPASGSLRDVPVPPPVGRGDDVVADLLEDRRDRS